MSAIVTLLPTIAKGIESVNSIGEVLLSEDVEQNEGKKQLEDVTGTFDFEDVSFHYKNSDKPVLNHLNLHVKQGETIALVGESGAGKSTVLNLVIGFHLADGGKVLLDGNDMREIDLRTYRKHLAVVPQTSILFSGTIRENITYGNEHVSDEELERVIKAANLTDLMESLPNGVDTMVGEHGGKLSGGQRQALTLLMATLQKPKLLLLDEHTAALDPKTAAKVLEITEMIVNRDHLTTMMITHNMQDAIIHGNRLIMMMEGRIILDIQGEEKKKLTVRDLLDQFEKASGQEFSNDSALLS